MRNTTTIYIYLYVCTRMDLLAGDEFFIEYNKCSSHFRMSSIEASGEYITFFNTKINYIIVYVCVNSNNILLTLI